MSRYAIVIDGVVTNIAKAESPIGENWIDATGAQIGSTWDGVNFTDPEPIPEDPKMVGVEILGVMCSATGRDQEKLSALTTGAIVSKNLSQPFPDTLFEFKNGNTLIITESNFEAIYGIWFPFRQSFFAVK
jgi:hypothetical protein